MSQEFASFEEFWSYYVSVHSDKTNRRLHFAGTTAAMACVAGGLVFRKWWLLAAAPIVGYGAAWIGHFVFERNVPASFDHPIWSFKGDMKMWLMTVKGEMDAEVERVRAERTRGANGVEAASESHVEPTPAPN